MKLEKLTIKNFKSLADVTIEPSDLTVIIGPNGSGKTNLANAFAFLKEVYANGLETAVQRSGGFENIASARQNRSKFSGIEFSITYKSKFSEFFDDVDFLTRLDRKSEDRKVFISNSHDQIDITHGFSINSDGTNLESNFIVAKEYIYIERKKRKLFSLEKIRGRDVKTFVDQEELPLQKFIDLMPLFNPIDESSNLELWALKFPLEYIIKGIRDSTSQWSIYQLLPNTAKAPGVPTPNPILSFYGSNLPILVDYIVRKESETWQLIIDTMRRVIPTLENITTGYLYNKTVGLFFHEEGFDRPWNAEEVSDGTILTLAMLCSVNDPRTTLVFIEEPENSLHPWILRELLQNFKGVAEKKDIMVTTHSPTLIDMVAPNDIWCISKADRKTQLNRLTDIAENLQSDWEAGIYKTSDYLDSGLVAQAIPGGSI